MLICSGVVWLIASEYGASRERARLASGDRGDNQDKAPKGVGPVDGPSKKTGPVEFAHDEAVEIGGIKIELLDGFVGKVMIRSDFGTGEFPTKEDHFQIRYRVTNNKENYILDFLPWRYGASRLEGDPSLKDEFGNEYRHFYDGMKMRVGKDIGSNRMKPGAFVEELLAFERPLENAKAFRLKLSGSAIKQYDQDITFKILRSFFIEKTKKL